MHIPLRTVDRFSNTLFILYQCDTLQDFITATMHEIRHLVPYENGAYFPVNPSTAEFESPFSMDLDNRLFADYCNYYQQYDCYRTSVFLQHPIPSVDRASDYLSLNDWGKNEHRADFLIPNKMFYLAGLQLFHNDTLVSAVSIHRNKQQGDFDDAAVLLLQMLSRHLQSIFTKIKDTENKAPLSIILQKIRALHNLTEREAEILKLLTKGCSNKQIGDQLYISSETVKTHLRSLFHKTNCSSRTELLSRFITLI